MQPVQPILTSHLFPVLHQELMQLLHALTPAEWQTPTVCTPWTVKDVTAHLLDGYVRRLSFQRDQLPLLSPEKPISSAQDLVQFLDGLNADWVRAYQRVSPALLVELLQSLGPKVHQLFASLDPFGPALFGVAWAGEANSVCWFDVAREYTEQWHHQQHIRQAVGRPGASTRDLFYPVLDTFVRVLPFTFREIPAGEGTAVVLEVAGPAGGSWSLVRGGEKWVLYEGVASNPAAVVRLAQETAWQLFTKGLTPAELEKLVYIEGQERLGRPVYSAVAIMAS